MAETLRGVDDGFQKEVPKSCRPIVVVALDLNRAGFVGGSNS